MKKTLILMILGLLLSGISFAIETTKTDDGQMIVTASQSDPGINEAYWFYFDRIIDKHNNVSYRLRIYVTHVPNRTGAFLYKVFDQQCKLIIDNRDYPLSYIQTYDNASEEVDRFRRQGGSASYTIPNEAVEKLQTAKSINVIVYYENAKPYKHVCQDSEVEEVSKVMSCQW